jgi:hypothetical protein
MEPASKRARVSEALPAPNASAAACNKYAGFHLPKHYVLDQVDPAAITPQDFFARLVQLSADLLHVLHLAEVHLRKAKAMKTCTKFDGQQWLTSCCRTCRYVALRKPCLFTGQLTDPGWRSSSWSNANLK